LVCLPLGPQRLQRSEPMPAGATWRRLSSCPQEDLREVRAIAWFPAGCSHSHGLACFESKTALAPCLPGLLHRL